MAVIFIEQRPVTTYVKQMVDGVEKDVAVQTFKEEKKIISLATIQSPLGAQFRITGLNGQGESSELALLLRAGGLAAPMYFAEERTIGPSLGADNITKGIDASLWGMDELERFYEHLEQTLVAIEFLDPEKPRHLMARLRRLYGRSSVSRAEMNILRGILTETQKAARGELLKRKD